MRRQSKRMMAARGESISCIKKPLVWRLHLGASRSNSAELEAEILITMERTDA